MNISDWPEELCVFEGDFSVVDGDIDNADGFGRIWVRSHGNHLPQQFSLKIGSDVLRIAASSQTSGSDFLSFVIADRGWIAKIRSIQNGGIRLSLYGFGDLHKAQNLDLQFKSSVNEVNDHSFDEGCRIIDSWSSRDLLLLRYEAVNDAIFLVGKKEAGQIVLIDGVPEIAAIKTIDRWGAKGRWVLLDSAPLNTTTSHWNETSIMFLKSLRNSMSDFMDSWRQYNDAEERLLTELHERVGVLQYGNLRKVTEGNNHILFEISVNRGGQNGECLALLQERVERHGSVWLEISAKKPVSDSEDRHSKSDNIRVEVELIDTPRSSIQFRYSSRKNEVPFSGFLYVSIAGDITQIERRREAEARFVNGECELKGLSEILREAPSVVSKRRSHEVGVSPKMLAQFSGELTPRQIQAIDMAINTPDIALIQGPPGTGKTQVIALIEQRLAELAGVGRHNSLILLTSTQNDAVDQVAARTRIFGLPPDRDIGRGDVDPIEVWRKERLEAVSALLDAEQVYRKVKALGNLVEQITNGNCALDEQIFLLSELETFATDTQTRQVISTYRTSLRGKLIKKADRQRIERKIRALRTTKVSFADDGRERIVEIDREIKKKMPKEWCTRFEVRIAELLLGADDWEDCQSLKEDLLDMFFDYVDDRPRRFEPDVRRMARNIRETFEKSALPVKNGAVISIGEALDKYVDEISNVNGIDEIVRMYTFVHAATCQRSSKYFYSNGLSSKSLGFENVIVDEAARVNPTDLLIPLVQARRRVILVGDHRQLPTTFDDEIAHGVVEADLLKTSLFERLFALLQVVGRNTGIPRTITLDTQYRMHPRLGDFVSRHFYEPYGEGINSGLSKEAFDHDIKGFESRTSVWIDVPLKNGAARRTKSRSWERPAEAIEVAQLVSRIVRENPDTSVGVITFYSAQKELILGELDEGLVTYDEFGTPHIAEVYTHKFDTDGNAHERLRIGSVDAFQGKEFDVIILSLVRSQEIRMKDTATDIYGFAAIENRMCVALSRQKKLLIVVGDKAMASSDTAKSVKGLHGLVELCDEEDLSFGMKATV
jgi:hypothetical protein